jgi:AcrR family transcriptional regulator
LTRPRGRPTAISREQLLDAALAIIDREGTEAVTMRRLAADLGVSPMAAYRHVESKEDLLRHAAAAVVRDLPAAAPGTPWPEVLQTFFERFYDRLLEHPGVAGLFGGQAFLSETVYAAADPVFAALLDAGFAPADAMALFMGCASCSIGSAILHAAAARQDGAGEPDAGVALVSATAYPAVAAVAAHLPDRQSRERHAQALRALIAGFPAPSA